MGTSREGTQVPRPDLLSGLGLPRRMFSWVIVSLKTAGPQQGQKEAVQHAPGLSTPPPRTVPQFVKQIQTLVSGSQGFPSAGCRHLILTCSAPRGQWPSVAKRAERGGLLPLRRTPWARRCPPVQYSDRLQLCVQHRGSAMPLRLGSSGVCTGPQEGLQGQRDARFLGRGGHAPGWVGGRALFPPSLSCSVMGSG